ncbi:response regulator transcription factor [Methylomarinum vadi]|uniref:response regulator transcription factor n=1 Tax=Methylomarinum vadi TaxID=438855 RepID=UPI0004DEF51C|nr:response regulator transcription factor [Methylomarinum vadi]
MTEKAKLLIIEDEQAILQGLIDVFVYHGYQVDSAPDGRLGLDKALSGQYDLILLDIMLPKLDGFGVCNKIREQDKQLPIIMLTAKSSEQDIIAGLTLGADDYIAKPFSVRELVLRVEAVLKRSGGPARQHAVIRLGERRIDCVNLCEIDGGRPNHFSRREIDILHYLLRHCDRPVSREELLQRVWGYRHAEVIETRTVDIHIAKLRRKIETDPKQPEYLVTVRGEGYRLMT